MLGGIHYQRCPGCGSDISDHPPFDEPCRLCGSSARAGGTDVHSLELEVLRKDLNERIDQIGDSIVRREREHSRMSRRLDQKDGLKKSLDW